jgi:hypothetical protein
MSLDVIISYRSRVKDKAKQLRRIFGAGTCALNYRCATQREARADMAKPMESRTADARATTELGIHGDPLGAIVCRFAE